MPRGVLDRSRLIAGALLCLGLAACGASRVSTGNHSTFYGPGVVSYAASDGTMPLVMRGNPFPLPQAQAEAAVARNFYLPGWFQQATFVPTSAEGADGQYRVVMVFNAATPVSASAACGDVEDIAVTPPADELTLRAAFCAGDYVVSDVFGRSPTAPPDSPAFRNLLGQISYTLFPAYNPTLQDDEDRFPFFGFGPSFKRG